MAWKIGEVISRTGLTARALHFYEEQGLIGPVSRNGAGHRVYTSSDLLKLQQIKTLRSLGIPLASMSPLLTDPVQLVPQLRQQLDRLHQQRDAIQYVEARISMLIDQLETRALTSDDLDEVVFQTLESMTMYDKYLNQEDINEMHRKGHGGEEHVSLEDAWEQWVSQMQTSLDAGTDPQSSEVQKLMLHWNDLINHLTGGEEEKKKAFNELLHNEPKARHDHGISDELFDFMGKASGGH